MGNSTNFLYGDIMSEFINLAHDLILSWKEYRKALELSSMDVL